MRRSKRTFLAVDVRLVDVLAVTASFFAVPVLAVVFFGAAFAVDVDFLVAVAVFLGAALVAVFFVAAVFAGALLVVVAVFFAAAVVRLVPVVAVFLVVVFTGVFCKQTHEHEGAQQSAQATDLLASIAARSLRCKLDATRRT